MQHVILKKKVILKIVACYKYISSKLSKKKKKEQVAKKQQSKIMCEFNQPDDNAIPPNGRKKFIIFNFFPLCFDNFGNKLQTIKRNNNTREEFKEK